MAARLSRASWNCWARIASSTLCCWTLEPSAFVAAAGPAAIVPTRSARVCAVSAMPEGYPQPIRQTAQFGVRTPGRRGPRRRKQRGYTRTPGTPAYGRRRAWARQRAATTRTVATGGKLSRRGATGAGFARKSTACKPPRGDMAAVNRPCRHVAGPPCRRRYSSSCGDAAIATRVRPATVAARVRGVGMPGILARRPGAATCKKSLQVRPV